jgi:hypothetical protein
MLPKNEVTKIYETILSIPGMNQSLKVNIQTSRKNLLLLSKVIERGLNGNQTDDKSTNILDTVPKEILEELREISMQLLSKAGLTEMNEKLNSFQ